MSATVGDKATLRAEFDPAVFDDPDAFCPGRDKARLHFTFGHTSHHCIGASLSRLEGRIATGLDVEWDLPARA
ncbi:hypothetical protein [Streptosporangium sp. NPDC002544]|uniref:hypothetical protein n=1 Tax=unclassified Streptosporangium TaxID=2632669 RepID=UPI003316FA50